MKYMRGNKIDSLKWIILSVFLVIGIFSLFSFVSLVVIMINRIDNLDDHENIPRTSQRYKIRKYNPDTNTSSVGTVTLLQDLSENEFITYRSELGEYTMISNFEAHEYKCTGNCLCEVGERRNQVTSISKGIIYLVAAGSSILAFKFAEEWFKEQCGKTLKDLDDCDEDSVTAEYECTDIETVEEMERRIAQKVYVCEGYCADIEHERISEDPLKCKGFKLLERIKVSAADIIPEVFFQVENLEPFCEGVLDDKEGDGFCVANTNRILCVPETLYEDKIFEEYSSP